MFKTQLNINNVKRNERTHLKIVLIKHISEKNAFFVELRLAQ